METDSPTPVADGGGEGTGGLGVVMAGSRDDYLGFPPKNNSFCVSSRDRWGVFGFRLFVQGRFCTVDHRKSRHSHKIRFAALC